MKRLLLLLLISAPAEAAVVERSLSLQDAVSSALSRSPEALKARERLNEGDAGVSLAWSALFPTVSADLQGTYRKDPLNIANPLFGGEGYNQYAFTLRATQPIFHAGGLFGAIRASKKEAEIRSLDLRIAERDLKLRTIEAFYGTILHRARLESYEGQLAAQTQLLKATQGRQRIGRSRDIDVLQIQAQVALLEPRISQEKNAMETASAELATLIGEREAAILQLKGALTALEWQPIVEEAKRSVDTIPELARAELQQAEVDDQRSVAMAKHWPSVDLVGAWGRQSYIKSELFDELSTAWNLGLQISIPIFSGLSSFHERKKLASQERQAEEEATRTRDESLLSQVRARKTLETSGFVLQSQTKAFTLTRTLLKEARRSYQISMIDYAQYFAIEKDAFQAELDQEQAQHDLIQALAGYLATSGFSLDPLIRKLDSEGK